MGIKIVCDSSADLPADIKAQVTTVPLTLRFGDREYTDGVDIDRRRFYEMLVESDTLPTTSQATPSDFDRVFSEYVASGDQVICITLSSKLSGTYQSACIAASEYPDKVFVIDSKSVAIGSGILAQYALQLRDCGLSAEGIAATLGQEKEKVHVIALLDTLEYLKKGGRISKSVAFAGGLLNIKPVACIDDGEVRLLGKARGSKMGNNLLVQEIQKAGGICFSKPLLLGYTGLSDMLLKKYIEDSAHLWQTDMQSLPQTQIGSIIGTHAGPGAVAVAFFSNGEGLLA